MFEKRVGDLDSLLKNYIQELQKSIRVEQVILFGSYGRGSPHDYSDIDIAVISPDFEGGTEKDCLLLDRVARKIHPLLEAMPYRPNDLKDFEPGDFLDEVLQTGRVVYKRAT